MDSSTKAINYASIIFGGVLGTAVGWIIYRKTVARAKELEIEELEAAAAAAGAPIVPGSLETYSDDDADAGERDAAALMNDDDISLWDNEDPGYRDNFTDDEDVFARGDVDEEAAIGGTGNRKSQT